MPIKILLIVARYKNYCITHPKIKYIFSYPEIYKFEKSFDNFFNEHNSYLQCKALSRGDINIKGKGQLKTYFLQKME